MNFFWLIALAMAAYIAFVALTGVVRIRGQLLADRAIEPKRFYFYLAGFACGLLLLIVEAINPPY